MTPFYTPFSNKGQKAYVSGPMSGYPDNNFPAFDELAAELREQGYRVCSPADTSRYLSQHGKLHHHEFLRFDFERVLEADFLMVLPGWEASLGALAEIHMAIRLDLMVYRSDPMFVGRVRYEDVVEAMHNIHAEAVATTTNLAEFLGFQA